MSFAGNRDPRASQANMASIAPVIIIDDDEFFRVAIETVLNTRFDVEHIVVCSTAQEALRHLSDGTTFGLGLVDLNMSGIDNKGLLEAIKSAQPAIRLVVLSASRSRKDILMALSAGAQGFINKGLGIGEMEAALQQIASGGVYLPPFTPMLNEGQDDAEPVPDIENPAGTLAVLTPRQLEVLHLLVAGQPNKGIARALDINHSTVKFHLSFIFRILGASNRVEAAILGAKLLKTEQ